MAYRKIEIDGTTYEYTIGKTHVKVKGLEAAPKEKVGEMEWEDWRCECCGESYASLGRGPETGAYYLKVRPEHIRKFILENR